MNAIVFISGSNKKYNMFASFLLLSSMTLGYGHMDRKSIGVGLHRNSLKNLQGEGTSTTCENVEQYFFKDAVIDNFDAIQNQQKWVGSGQRYWMNKQFWRYDEVVFLHSSSLHFLYMYVYIVALVLLSLYLLVEKARNRARDSLITCTSIHWRRSITLYWSMWNIDSMANPIQPLTCPQQTSNI